MPQARQLRALNPAAAEHLSEAERFAFELAAHPRLRPMLDALASVHSLPPSIAKASAALDAVCAAARAATRSAALGALFEALLTHGNFLNANTPRGGAAGVTFDSLPKAAAHRSRDGKTTLVRHVVGALGLNFGEKLRAELGGALAAAVKMPVVDLLLLVKEVQLGWRAIEQELALCPVDDLEADLDLDADLAGEARDGAGAPRGADALLGRRFRAAIGQFVADAAVRVTELGAKQAEAKEQLSGLATFLGEDPNCADPDAMLRALASLTKAVDTAVDEAARLERQRAATAAMPRIGRAKSMPVRGGGGRG